MREQIAQKAIAAGAFCKSPWALLFFLAAFVATDPLKELAFGHLTGDGMIGAILQNAADLANSPLFRLAMVPLMAVFAGLAVRDVSRRMDRDQAARRALISEFAALPLMIVRLNGYYSQIFAFERFIGHAAAGLSSFEQKTVPFIEADHRVRSSRDFDFDFEHFFHLPEAGLELSCAPPALRDARPVLEQQTTPRGNEQRYIAANNEAFITATKANISAIRHWLDLLQKEANRHKVAAASQSKKIELKAKEYAQ